MIYPDTEGSDKARAVDRIGKQITANRHREGLTAAQHTRGVAQMLEFGASITKVSKTLAMNKKDVKAQAAVGKAEAARTALDAGQLDLEQAAVVAEFEEAGDTEAVDMLLKTGPYNFTYTAQRIRDRRAEEARTRRTERPHRSVSNDYHYPGTTVLRNRLGYTDPHTLAQAEALIAATRMAELATKPIDGHFDFAHLQAIHRHLLGDLYEWAGEIRTIDTAPGDLGILHGPPAAIPSELDRHITPQRHHDLPAALAGHDRALRHHA